MPLFHFICSISQDELFFERQAVTGKDQDDSMEFYRKLYVGSSIKDSEKVKWKLKHNAGQFSVYVIALSQSDDQLDIFHCCLLKQRYYSRENLFVVGIAGNYGEAVEIVVQLAGEVAAATGDGDIKGYILENR